MKKFCLLLFLLLLLNFPGMGQTGKGTNNIQMTGNPSPLQSLLMVEAIAFGGGALSTVENGAYAAGTIFGAGSATMVGINIFSGSDTNTFPEFTLPYAAGLGVLSYYNFRFAGSHSPRRKFWTNAIGFNAIVVGSIASALIFSRNRKPQPNTGTGSMQLSYFGSGLTITISL